MGRARKQKIKKLAKRFVEEYHTSLTKDFYVNKKVVQENTIIQSKKMTNKIAGWTTHLMRRIEQGPVKGISIKLQEEERERRDNYVPSQSALDRESVVVSDTMIQMIEDARVPVPPNYLQTEDA